MEEFQDFSSQQVSESLQPIDYEERLKVLKPGQFLTGQVIKIESDAVLVDIGYKSEGVIPLDELSFKKFSDPAEIVSVGEKIEVMIIKLESDLGCPVLSKKRAELESSWRKIVEAYHKNQPVTGPAVEIVKGGLIVDIGIRGFLPASHVNINLVKNLDKFLGEPLTLKILQLDEKRRRVVLSRKKFLEEEREKKKKDLQKSLYEGALVTGKVVRLTTFGAFVDLGGMDGLIHISELSYRHIKHPREVLKPGDRVEAIIIKIDPSKEKISLSLRQAQPDPWLTIEDKFTLGELATGRVTKLARNYIFVEVADGIVGLIPLSELAEGKLVKPEEILKLDQKITVKILDIRPQERRIILSLRQADLEAKKDEYKQYFADQNTSTFTVGDLLKGKIKFNLPEKQDPKDKNKG